MLKAQILAAVKKAKTAVQDLAVPAKHVKRGSPVHVPGSAPTYPETLTDVSIVFTRYSANEVDGERVQASDWRGIVFPETGLTALDTNDIIRLATSVADLITGDYRILGDSKVMAGDTVALHQLHLRKL